MDNRYPVVEIFESLQGEGTNTGLDAVFIRFGQCNLACPWCDTDVHAYQMMSLEAVTKQVETFTSRHLIITGGEPLLQEGLVSLVDFFKIRGYWLALETNGLIRLPETVSGRIDFVAVSPKSMAWELYDDEQMIRSADEVRIVVDGAIEEFCREMRNRIEAKAYFLSPCEVGGVMNMKQTLCLLGKLNAGMRTHHWRLSVQAHKLAGMR